MINSFTIPIHGHLWLVRFNTPEEEPEFEKCYGFTDFTAEEIAINSKIDGTISNKKVFTLKVLRHEIIHAFMQRCGLHICYENSEKDNEVTVDWFAIQWHELNTAIEEAEKEAMKILNELDTAKP